MEIVPHVDIVGDDRIQAILDDPRNFNLIALRAETLQDWLPDIGTYLAPNECRAQNGVFRTVGLAASGIPAVLRHRFWRPEDAVRITGIRYIGLLLFDSTQDNYTFEISSGADPVGAVRPWRHDNRRHLIVCTKPAHILGGYIPFTVQALGTGPCSLESIVFLPECPEGSSFTPHISRLSAQAIHRDDGNIAAQVHFVTSEAAIATVEMTAEGETHSTSRGETKQPERLHVVTVAGLKPQTRYHVSVTATERGGVTAQAATTLDTGAEVKPEARRVSIPVEIVRLGAAPAGGLPLTFGVPVAQGVTAPPQGCLIQCNGEVLPAQTRVHSRWPDGSARWVLIDVPCPRALDTSEHATAHVSLNTDQTGRDGLSWTRGNQGITVTGSVLRVNVSTRRDTVPLVIEHRGANGSWRPVFGRRGVCLSGALGNGVALQNGRIEALALEETGPERVVIRYEMPLLDTHGIEHFRTTIRLHIYARQPFLRLIQRTVVTSPALGAAFGSSSLDHLTPQLEHVRSALCGSEGEETSLFRVDSLTMTLPFLDLDGGRAGRIVHEHDRGYIIQLDGGVRTIEGHWGGLLTLPSRHGLAVLSLKDAWQTYPKGVRYDSHDVTLEILPKLSGQPLPDYDELWHKLYYWYDRATAQYRLKAGMAVRTETLIGWADSIPQAETWHQSLTQPVVVRPDIEYLNSTKALLPLTSKARSPHRRYEAFMDGSYDVWQSKLEARHEYGFANFGDTYSDLETFWSNNEYDGTFIQYVEFLRGGDARWTLLGQRTARHLMDVDTCNYSRQPSQVGAQYMHIPGHAGGFLPPYFRSKTAGSSFIPSHSWVEGLVLHYLLTGDETAADILNKTGTQYTRDLRFYRFRNARECGWHLIHLCGLARLNDSPLWLNAASIIVATVLSKQEPGGGWEHPLSEAHCWHAPPHCHGEAGFMVGVLLAGLRRYYYLTDDSAVADAIVGGARWLVRKIYLPDVELFRYTSCPLCRQPGTMGGQLVEGLATAYQISPEPGIAAALRCAMSQIGQDEEIHMEEVPRYGRSISMEARYIPTMLHLVKELV